MAVRLDRDERLTCAWVLILGIFALTDAWISVLRGIGVELVASLASVALFLRLAARMVRQRSRRALVALTLLVVAVSLWFSPARFWIAVYCRTWVDSLRYARDIADLKAGRPARCVLERRCLVEDPGPNARVAFVWDGLAVHSFGIVFDEQGTLRDLEPGRSEFGGWVLSARHLWGPWFYCVFE